MNWLRNAAEAAFLTILITATGVFVTPVFGSVMESESWQIKQDSINFGGGYGASDNYVEESTYGEVGTGWSYSDSFSLHAGYQQMDEAYIAMSVEAVTTTMAPAIPGMSGGTASGTNVIVVKTDNDIGYSLEVEASTSPAMQTNSSTAFSDYAPGAVYPDFNWDIPATTSAFGFTPEGVDIVNAYKDNGFDTCNQPGGSDTPDKCWDGFSTVAKVLSQSASFNETGATTTIKIQAEVGSQYGQPSGQYHAILTITAYVN